MTASSVVRTATSIVDPNNPNNVLVPNVQNGANVTKSDSTIFSPAALALWVGGVGDVAVRMFGNQQSVTFTAVPSGTLLTIQVDKVLSTGTSATNIVRLW